MYSSVPPTPPSCLGRLLLPLAPTSCLRTKAYGKALKKLRAVHTHFIDIIEDQFDFHTYCLRKMTLRAYVTLLRCEDSIYKHKFFRRAAHSLVECCVLLHDNPHTCVRMCAHT